MTPAPTEAKFFIAFARLLTLLDLFVGFFVAIQLGYDQLWAAVIVTMVTVAFAFGLVKRYYWAFQLFVAIALLVNIFLIFALFPPFGFDQDSPLASTQIWKLVAYTFIDLGICLYIFRNRDLLRKGESMSSAR